MTPEHLYREAKAFERGFVDCCRAMFEETDVLLLPVSREPAPKRPMTPEPRRGLLEGSTPGSLGRIPVFTIPVRSGGLSLGLQCLLHPDRWREALPEVFSALNSPR